MLDPMFRTMRAFWLANARASVGGSTLELAGAIAAIVPAMPDRSVVNSVVYDDAGALERGLDSIAAAYEDAGVRAWTVWVHESDERARELLAAAGHVLDAHPMGQARELAGVDELPHGDLDLHPDPVPADFDPVVESAYGWPGFAAAIPAFPPGFHAYVALLDARPACCLGLFDCNGDTGVQLVGTVSEARGRGLAGRLLARALVDARERGCTTTTLQATAMGQPVYTRLGYRDLGRIQMWERRKPAPPG
ncbi:MAG TPA: GNAT family N-acetyltransferase [Thermoleophilaceae bacterium]